MNKVFVFFLCVLCLGLPGTDILEQSGFSQDIYALSYPLETENFDIRCDPSAGHLQICFTLKSVEPGDSRISGHISLRLVSADGKIFLKLPTGNENGEPFSISKFKNISWEADIAEFSSFHTAILSAVSQTGETLLSSTLNIDEMNADCHSSGKADEKMQQAPAESQTLSSPALSAEAKSVLPSGEQNPVTDAPKREEISASSGDKLSVTPNQNNPVAKIPKQMEHTISNGNPAVTSGQQTPGAETPKKIETAASPVTKNISPPSSAAPGQSAHFSDIEWFSPAAEVFRDWHIEPDMSDKMRFSITPRKKPETGKLSPIFVLFPKKSSAYDTAMSTILNVFNDKKIYAAFTVVNFLAKEDLGTKALAEAESGSYSLIFSMGSESTDFVYLKYKGKTPVVSVCSKDPVLMKQTKDYVSGSGTNIAYTSLNVPVELQMAYLKELIPDLRNIIVMYARNNKSAIITQYLPLKDIALTQDINISEVVVEKDPDAKMEIEEKLPGAVEEIIRNGQEKSTMIWITGSTSVFREIETINRYAKMIPVLSAVPDVVSEGNNSAVLSIGVSFESNAYLAGIYSVSILRGESEPGKMKVGIVSPPDIAINFKKAREIGLKIPFKFFELAAYVYDPEGNAVRIKGQKVR